MDVFDEFEIKPLTEGLGFHRKSNDLKSSMKKSKPMTLPNEPLQSSSESLPSEPTSIDKATEALDKLMSSLNTLDKKGITFSETLPRENSNSSSQKLQSLQQPSIHPVVPGSEPAPVNIEVPYNDEAPSSSTDSVRFDTPVDLSNLGAGTRRGASDSFSSKLKAAPVSIPAAILDSIVIFALSMLFMMGMLLATGLQISSLVDSLTTDIMTKVSAFMLLVAVLQMYVVLARSFFGCTLGEWTFDCQMGTDHQVKAPYYPFQIVWRSILIIGTGLVTLPFLSLISRRDLGSYLTGLQLYKKI